MYIRAIRLGIPLDASRDLISLDNYINDELIRRLGVEKTLSNDHSDHFFSEGVLKFY